MRKTIIALIALVILTGCQKVIDTEWLPRATSKWGNGYTFSDSLYDRIADYPVFSYQFNNVFDDARFNKQELIRRNPTIKIGAYLHTNAVAEWQINDPRPGFAQDWAAWGLKHLAYTTEGDTARIFNNQYMVDITQPGAVEEQVAIIKKYAVDPAGVFIMFDYFTVPQPVFVYGQQREDMHGEIDTNGDGIPHSVDADEIAALRQAFSKLVQLTRKEIPGIRIIGNGVMPYRDEAFAKSLDGVFLEGGFRWGWGPDQVLAGMPEFQDVIDWYRDDPIILIENDHNPQDALLIAMMFDNCYGIIKADNNKMSIAGDPHDMLRHLGSPLAPHVQTGDTYSREFQGGMLTIEMTASEVIFGGRYPHPFSFVVEYSAKTE